MTPTDYNVFTLVDITDTNENNPKGGTKTYKQAQNLNSLVQSLSMRSQPLHPKVSALVKQDLNDYDFGVEFTGTATVWRMTFSCEIENAWQNDTDRVYFAMLDLDNVPIYTGLDESINIYEQKLISHGRYKNIYIT
jgi:hypothetical protein